MSSIMIIFLILLVSVIVYFVLLRKKSCITGDCNDSRAEEISRAKMNLDPKWNKGCVRDPKTGQFRRK